MTVPRRCFRGQLRGTCTPCLGRRSCGLMSSPTAPRSYRCARYPRTASYAGHDIVLRFPRDQAAWSVGMVDADFKTSRRRVHSLSSDHPACGPFRPFLDQDFDQSIVIFRLDLKPGDVVIESGTGSGAMSSVSTVAGHHVCTRGERTMLNLLNHRTDRQRHHSMAI